jgi:hypothetical protein
MGVERPSLTTGSYMGDAFSFRYTFNFKYTVNGDGTWTTDVVGPVVGTGIAGPRIGQTVHIYDFPTLTGQISQNASTLTAASTLTPQVETLTFTAGASPLYRICDRSEVLIKAR